MYTIEYPQCYQIRKNCIIAYTDPSYFKRKVETEEEKEREIKHSYTFSGSAKKKMGKILDLWTWTLENSEPKYSFITLTISAKIEKEINHYTLLKEWIEKMETRYNKFNYVWKAELQKNGNVHYHLIVDKEINWKIVRRQWNKSQSFYVDKYQMKMKEKYKKGYFYDNKMVDKKGEIINEETQKKRYDIGTKGNWRNPNSTDVVIPENVNEISGYISKYINKKEEEEIENKNEIKRWWGCNEELKQLKYAVIFEEKENINVSIEMKNHHLRNIEENGKIKCSIIEKFNSEKIRETEELKKVENLNILYKKRDINSKLIQKEIQLYDKIYGQ